MVESPTHVKRFAEILKKDHRYITCNTTSDCLEYVKNGNAVYAGVILRNTDPVTTYYSLLCKERVS